ncbi:MAG: SPW repeat protein [Dehalococcoidia bacterium]|nr:SPW repeat protein [Dehalococcoidia bacterium]
MARVGGWFSFVVTLIGLWFIASPWVYGFTDNTGLMWNSIILGAVTAIFSFVAGWELVAHPTEMGMRRPVT